MNSVLTRNACLAFIMGIRNAGRVIVNVQNDDGSERPVQKVSPTKQKDDEKVLIANITGYSNGKPHGDQLDKAMLLVVKTLKKFKQEEQGSTHRLATPQSSKLSIPTGYKRGTSYEVGKNYNVPDQVPNPILRGENGILDTAGRINAAMSDIAKHEKLQRDEKHDPIMWNMCQGFIRENREIIKNLQVRFVGLTGSEYSSTNTVKAA